jgi:hypothetical protein
MLSKKAKMKKKNYGEAGNRIFRAKNLVCKEETK